MAQFIKTPFSGDICNTLQVSQISYRNDRIIEINYCRETERAVIQDNQQLFYFHNPAIKNITIRDILYGLGYGNNHIIITWVISDFHLRDVLDIPIINIPLSQLYLYDNKYPIPDIEYPDENDCNDPDENDCNDPVDSEDDYEGDNKDNY